MRLICGVDEAGRGPLAGPVYAAAVVLPADYDLPGLTDSKKLNETQRHRLEVQICQIAIGWAIASASVAEIDAFNILRASLLAMQRAVLALDCQPDELRVDGLHVPDTPVPAQAIVQGDLTEPAISAASILAKNARDRELLRLHGLYPQYGFDRHKGYPTAAHIAALNQFGICPEHRTSFSPVRRIISQGLSF